jgi:hypothetical protein
MDGEPRPVWVVEVMFVCMMDVGYLLEEKFERYLSQKRGAL